MNRKLTTGDIVRITNSHTPHAHLDRNWHNGLLLLHLLRKIWWSDPIRVMDPVTRLTSSFRLDHAHTHTDPLPLHHGWLDHTRLNDPWLNDTHTRLLLLHHSDHHATPHNVRLLLLLLLLDDAISHNLRHSGVDVVITHDRRRGHGGLREVILLWLLLLLLLHLNLNGRRASRYLDVDERWVLELLRGDDLTTLVRIIIVVLVPPK